MMPVIRIPRPHWVPLALLLWMGALYSMDVSFASFGLSIINGLWGAVAYRAASWLTGGDKRRRLWFIAIIEAAMCLSWLAVDHLYPVPTGLIPWAYDDRKFLCAGSTLTGFCLAARYYCGVWYLRQ